MEERKLLSETSVTTSLNVPSAEEMLPVKYNNTPNWFDWDPKRSKPELKHPILQKPFKLIILA